MNSRRTSSGACGSRDCHDLRYTISGLGGGPYTLECWFDGKRVWRGTWSGRASYGCQYSTAFSGSVHVVIDGVKSNTLSITARAAPPTTTTTPPTTTQPPSSAPTVSLSRSSLGPCRSGSDSCRWLNVDLRGFEPGRYRLSCHNDGWNGDGAGSWWSESIAVGQSGNYTDSKLCWIDLAHLDGRNGVNVLVRDIPYTAQKQSNWLK